MRNLLSHRLCASFVCCLLVYAGTTFGAPAKSTYSVKSPTAEQAKAYRLDTSFYKKCTMVQNILIATSSGVSDHAHLEAAYKFDMIMKSIKKPVAQRIRDSKVL